MPEEMGLLSIIITFFVLFLIFSLFGWCCRRKTKGIIFNVPVEVVQPNPGSTILPHHAAMHTAAPYPTNAPACMPHSGGPSYPTGMPQPAYPPYPIDMSMPQPTSMPMPQAQPIGFIPSHSAPYPPQPPYPTTGVSNPPYPTNTTQIHLASGQNPPSYAEAVSTEVYAKQSPYNPNY